MDAKEEDMGETVADTQSLMDDEGNEMGDTPDVYSAEKDIATTFPDVDVYDDLYLTSEEVEKLSQVPEFVQIIKKACKKITSLKIEVQTRDRDLEMASTNLENVLISQGSHNTLGNEFEQKFYAEKREKDDLLIRCACLQSQLESMKNTAASAIATFGAGESKNEAEDEEIMNDAKRSNGISSTDSVGDLTSLLEDMTKKMQINSADAELEAPLVLEFLKNLYKQKEGEREAVLSQLQILSGDIAKMEDKVGKLKQRSPKRPRKSKSPLGKRGGYQPESDEEDEQSMVKKSKLLDSRFTHDLESTYFSTRNAENPDNALQTFSQHLSTFTRFSKMESVATIGYRASHDLGLMSSKVSTIEFDGDEDYFAIGGDLKEIQVFAYSADDVATGKIAEKAKELTPLQTMITPGLISDLSWSNHSRGQIVCADLSGIVTLWDSSSASQLVQFREHENNQVHSVDYSYCQPGILASAGADCTVRLWDVREPGDSTAVITSSASVCCVRFNPSKDYELAFGNANSLAYIYDTRKVAEPLKVLAEHKGTVCGISYHKHDQLVTQSIDGSLKLWDFTKSEKATRTYKGHLNARHFTGLKSRRDHIACGSEDNSVVIYNLMISSPILRHSFEVGIPEQDANRYVSAVCWNKHANVMLAGNDAGIIQLSKLS